MPEKRKATADEDLDEDETTHGSEQEREDELKRMFEEFCKKHLDIGNLKEYLTEEEGKEVFKFDYFILILKTIFFWKKMRFEKMKFLLTAKRREFLFGQMGPPEKPNTDVKD